MSKILYIGNFLSKTHGTIGPAVSLIEKFRKSGHFVNSASSRKNKFLRMTEMCAKAAFNDYDTIIVDVYSTSALSFADACSHIAYCRKKHIILTLRGGGLPDAYRIKAARINKLLRRANVITTPSLYLQQFFQQLGFVVSYIPNTIDMEKFYYKEERPRDHSILWVRAFTKIYNPDIAVRVLSLVKKEFANATMTMVGPDKGNKEEIVALINELGLADSIKLTGKIPNEQLPDYYYNHDVYLNTTSYESFGVAVLEAAACGTPIVSTAVGEIPLLWEDGYDILLSENICERDLADNICKLFSNAELYKNIQENARRKAKDYSWEQVEALWNEVLTKTN